ncbi:MAG: HAD-IA family hydrolase [Armatimonadota bacterium]|nr:HAD-IA family hydrolase [Armatimonadota bacterium]
MLKAIIFDMDGVLVDSEEYICGAAIRMFAEKGYTVKPEDFIPFVGAGENRYIGGPAEKYGIPLDLESDKARTYEIYGELVKGLKPLTGAREFIGKCKDRGLKLAVASAADKVKVDINLGILDLPPGTFDVVVNGLDVEKKKPNPEIFLLAANRLGVPSSECLVAEDAVNGVAAAKAAGARCLAITTSFTPEQLAGADWFAPNLAEAPEEALEW